MTDTRDEGLMPSECWLCKGDGQWRPASCGVCGVLDGEADVRTYDGAHGPVTRCPTCADTSSELATLRASLEGAQRDLTLIRENCCVVYYVASAVNFSYPLEHTMAANKDQWDAILHELRAARSVDPAEPPREDRG